MERETPLLNLLCTEDMSSLNQTSIGRNDETFDFITVSRSDSDFVEMSFGKETSFRPDQNNRLKPLPKAARVEALKWVLQTMALFGYHSRTAYLALIYFDQFLVKTCLSDGKPRWTSRILSIACLSIAAKMEESNVRSVGEYQVDGYYFRGIAVQRMELCVLNTLNWKMAVITPFTYLSYFVTKFCDDAKSRHQEILTRAAEFVLRILEKINAADNRPSIVAAASVLAAYSHHLDREMLGTKMDAIPSWGSQEKDQTFSCYCLLLQEILMVKTPKFVITSLSAHDSTITSRSGSKRRLNFRDNNQYCPVKRNP